MSKPLNVVVWGASGFTGRLVCEHLAKDYQHKVKWALAGRSQEKLEAIRAELAEKYGADIRDTPILLGNLDDDASLDRIAGQTDVIISTAGPFALHGTPIVEAALRGSCDYVDITGEVPWVAQLIADHHEEAMKKNVRIVPCCGYDSIPSDLGSLLVVDHIENKLGKKAASVVSAVVDARGGFSGGTVATGMYQLSQAAKFSKDDKKKKNGKDTTYALIPAGETPGSDSDLWWTRYNDTLGMYLAPFVMQVCNTRVVHRSNYLLGWGGPAFSYTEALSSPSWGAAKTIALGTLATVGAMSKTWMHPLLRRVLPAPGEGPTREAMLTGRYKHSVVGMTVEESGTAPDVVIAEVGDPNRDPGYWGTSRMVLEAGLTLALQKKELDSDPGLKNGGVLTPASALGRVLIERLKAAGLTYEIKEVRKGVEAKA